MGGEVQLIFNISSWFASQNNSQNGGGSCSNIQSNLQRDRKCGGSWLVLILSDFYRISRDILQLYMEFLELVEKTMFWVRVIC